ncbi:MAG: tripartite tricarboxylate transporter TctB family protein [candidate division WOR-3 bacterium]
MGRLDTISGCFWLLFSLFISYESYKLGLGNVNQPGPGFLFFWTGIVIAILSVIVIVRSFSAKASGAAKEADAGRRRLTKIIPVLVALFLYALFIEWLGFIIVTLLLFLFILGVVEKKHWLFTIAVSVLVTVLSYLVFEVALQSQLPKGLLGFLRF